MLCGVAILHAGSAVAQEIEGEWTNTPSSCGIYSVNNDNIVVRADGYRIFETSCSFTGGSKQSSDHWIMTSVCNVEGGGEQTESIDLSIIGQALRVIVDGRASLYESKCQTTQGRPERTYWQHNGSVMYLVAEGNHRRFYYSEPRPGMQAVGAYPDSLLFEGTAEGNRYDGTAFIFSANCGSFPYHVSGPVLDDYRRVVLRGRAPRVNRNCQIIGHRPDELTFTLVPGQ